MKPDDNVLKQFNLQGDIEFLAGGEGRTFKVGQVVLKHINKDSEEYTNWIANLFSKTKEQNFRIAKPIQNISGTWVTEDGWSAWEFLEGDHNFKNHIQVSIKAIVSFHNALKDFSEHDFLKQDDNPFTRADKYAWGEKPEHIHSDLRDLVESLYSIRKPVEGLKDQIIHGDLNPENILVSNSLPPAIIDIAPYWRPPEFALAIYAYWIAAWRDEKELLKYFQGFNEFNQMLVRAGIRMLLIMSEFDKVQELEKYKKATEIILQRISKKI